MGINPPSDAYAINVMLLKRAIRRRRTMFCMQKVNKTNPLATDPRQSNGAMQQNLEAPANKIEKTSGIAISSPAE